MRTPVEGMPFIFIKLVALIRPVVNRVLALVFKTAVFRGFRRTKAYVKITSFLKTLAGIVSMLIVSALSLVSVIIMLLVGTAGPVIWAFSVATYILVSAIALILSSAFNFYNVVKIRKEFAENIPKHLDAWAGEYR